MGKLCKDAFLGSVLETVMQVSHELTKSAASLWMPGHQ